MPNLRSLTSAGCVTAALVSVMVGFVITPKGNDLSLSGAPEFIILAIMVAFGAYLRQISIQALELRDKIRRNDVWNFPPDKEYSRKKMGELDKTAQTIGAVTPFMIYLIIAVCIRIIVDTFVKMLYVRGQSPRFLFATDVFISCCLLIAFCGLAGAHFKSREVDAQIREQQRADEESNLARLNEKPLVKVSL